jgi:hypothetical protein
VNLESLGAYLENIECLEGFCVERQEYCCNLEEV